MEPTKAKFVWDYDISQEEFDDILAGRCKRGSLDRDWAAVRVIEWAPYEEMIKLIGFPQLVKEWPRWRSRCGLSNNGAALISWWNGCPLITRSC